MYTSDVKVNEDMSGAQSRKLVLKLVHKIVQNPCGAQVEVPFF